MIMRGVYTILFMLLAAFPATAQENRVVALVIAVGDQNERADAMQAQLQSVGAETLRANNPNNAELRTILTRFAREAANSRATFVYLAAPVIDFQDRTFILPADAVLNRGTDLFTQALPIQAFSRSAAQAGQGGTTIATLVPVPLELPKGTSPTTAAPKTISQSSPVLVAPMEAFDDMIAAFEAALQTEEVEVSTLLRRMTVLDGVTISEFPKRPIFLREKPQEVPEAPQVVLPEAVAVAQAPQTAPVEAADPAQTETSDGTEVQASESRTTDATTQPTLPAEPEETLEELNLLEQALSRAAKRSVQTQLRGLGHYKGLVDGIFGPQTRAAIEAFQSERDEEPTGVLTRRQLIELSS